MSSHVDLQLDPIQEHYLKKELINLQLIKEFNKLSVTYNDVTGLRKFGPPFAPYDPANPPLNYHESLAISSSYIDHYDAEFPILRHFFHHFLIKFPFILQYHNASVKHNDEQFWVNKVQKFYEIWKSKKISNSNDRGELSKRKLALFKMIKFLLMLYNSAIPTVSEEVYQEETAKKDKNAYKKLSKVLPLDSIELNLADVMKEDHYINGLEISVVGVRRNMEMKEIKSIVGSFQALNFWSSSNKNASERKYSKFYEFIIEVKVESTGETYYIARRYTEFKKLHQKLFKAFAGKELPGLPSKVTATADLDYNDDNDNDDEGSMYNDNDNDEDDAEDDQDDFQDADDFQAQSSMEADLANSIKMYQSSSDASKSSGRGLFSKEKPDMPKLKLPREKLRVSLRGYLKQLLKVPSVRNSEQFLEFLEREKFTEVTSEKERNDINLRRQLDILIVSQQLQFQKETIKMIQKIQATIEELKAGILRNDADSGLLSLFREIETKSSIAELSPPLKTFIELAKIEIASTIYELFVANDQSLEVFKILKRLHQYFPYKVVAAIMRFTNPMAIAKKLIDVFLIQPPSFSGNGKSLLQFIFTLTLNDDVKQLNKEILTLKSHIANKNAKYTVFIDKIEAYLETKDDGLIMAIKHNASQLDISLVLSVLLNNNDLMIKVPDELMEPLLNSYKQFRLLKKLHADETTVNAQEEYNSISTQAALFTHLDDFFKAALRKKDKDNLKDLWDEPELTRLIKEMITIFFQPLVKIFTEANVHLYIPIFKDFINDLIALINQHHSNYSMILSANNSIVVQFISLLSKYEDHMYTFIHNLYLSDLKNDENGRIFTNLVNWFNSFSEFLTFVKTGRPNLRLDLNDLINSMPGASGIDTQKLTAELNEIIDSINKKREMYQSILEDNPVPLQEGNPQQTSAVASNWADIHQNLSQAINLGSSVNPIQTAEIDELNMELLEFNTETKVDYFEKLTNQEFLQYAAELNANRKSGRSKNEIQYNDEESDFAILQRDTEIKKLSDLFGNKVHEILKESNNAVLHS